MIRGHLKFLVIKLLEKEPMSGYSLMDNIEEIIGHRPSSGSIYPLLDTLSKNNLVNIKEDGKTKIYSLSIDGKNKLKEIKVKKKEIFEKITGMMHVLGNICDEHESKFFEQMLKHMETGEMPFIHLEPELSGFKHTLISKANKKNKYTNEIKQIIHNTTKKIKDL